MQHDVIWHGFILHYVIIFGSFLAVGGMSCIHR